MKKESTWEERFLQFIEENPGIKSYTLTNNGELITISKVDLTVNFEPIIKFFREEIDRARREAVNSKYVDELLDSIRQEERNRLIKLVEENFWNCMIHDPLLEKGCDDCSEALSVNVILSNLLKQLQQ